MIKINLYTIIDKYYAFNDLTQYCKILIYLLWKRKMI